MELVRILKTPGARTKGAMAQFQWVNGHNAVKGDPDPGEPLRRVRRQLARSFEILRLCWQGKVPSRPLLQNVWPRGPFPNKIQDIRNAAQTQIYQLQQQQSSIEEQQKRTRIQAWKSKINDPSLKGISRWIKSQEEQNAQAEVVFEDTKGSLPMKSLLSFINIGTRSSRPLILMFLRPFIVSCLISALLTKLSGPPSA